MVALASPATDGILWSLDVPAPMESAAAALVPLDPPTPPAPPRNEWDLSNWSFGFRVAVGIAVAIAISSGGVQLGPRLN